MDINNIVSFTELARNVNKFTEQIETNDVVVVKNNKPVFIAVKPENYNKYKQIMKVINNYGEGEFNKFLEKMDKNKYKV